MVGIYQESWSELMLLIWSLFRSFLCSLKAKGSRVNPGQCHVKCCRVSCWGLPQDEDPAPGLDDFPPGGPFDLFGFGQNGPRPAAQPNQ